MKRIFAKIAGFLGSIPQDKLLHFIAGALIVALCATVRGFAPFAWSVAVLAGLLKEYHDSKTGGNADVRDFAATVAGAFMMQSFVWFYLMIWLCNG